MAKKEEKQKVITTKPAKVRPQTAAEIRHRLKKQSRKKPVPDTGGEGVHIVTDEEAKLQIHNRAERKAEEAATPNENVRLLTDKDIILRQSAAREREEAEGGKDGGTYLTEEQIKKRNLKPEAPEDPEDPDGAASNIDPVVISVDDIVAFEDGEKKVVGKVIKITDNDEAVVETEDTEYTVPLSVVIKVEPE